jgi:hypothetical protein
VIPTRVSELPPWFLRLVLTMRRTRRKPTRTSTSSWTFVPRATSHSTFASGATSLRSRRRIRASCPTRDEQQADRRRCCTLIRRRVG